MYWIHPASHKIPLNIKKSKRKKTLLVHSKSKCVSTTDRVSTHITHIATGEKEKNRRRQNFKISWSQPKLQTAIANIRLSNDTRSIDDDDFQYIGDSFIWYLDRTHAPDKRTNGSALARKQTAAHLKILIWIGFNHAIKKVRFADTSGLKEKRCDGCASLLNMRERARERERNRARKRREFNGTRSCLIQTESIVCAMFQCDRHSGLVVSVAGARVYCLVGQTRSPYKKGESIVD